MNAIFKRRSIRNYTDQEVEDKTITELLKAGMSAPSAGNAQTWEFIVIDDKNILNKIPEIHDYAQMVPDAAKAILVCGNEKLEKYDGFWPQDCAAATENILIEAADKGLGAVWLGIHPAEEREKDFEELFNLPEHITPFSLIPIGYPAEEKGKADRYTEEKVHYNRW